MLTNYHKNSFKASPHHDLSVSGFPVSISQLYFFRLCFTTGENIIKVCFFTCVDPK